MGLESPVWRENFKTNTHQVCGNVIHRALCALETWNFFFFLWEFCCVAFITVWKNLYYLYLNYVHRNIGCESCSLSEKKIFLQFHLDGVSVWLLIRFISILRVLKARDTWQKKTVSLHEGGTKIIESGASLNKVPTCYLFWHRLSSLWKIYTSCLQGLSSLCDTEDWLCG